MSLRRRKDQPKHKVRESDDTPNSDAFYVYGVGESEALSPLLGPEVPQAIEPEMSVNLVIAKPLAAVVSKVPMADYSEGVLDERLKDASWVAVRATLHERVVEYFARNASLVPLRFGTIYFQKENIRKMLRQKEAELQAVIERIRGKEEWGVNVYGDRSRLLTAIASVSPRLRELTERIASASTGEAYLLKKKIESLQNTEATASARRVIDRIEHELSLECDGAVRLRVLKGEATERGEVVAKIAFLVSRSRFDEFVAVAERLAGEDAELGFELELTGPWPAYNFAAGEL